MKNVHIAILCALIVIMTAICGCIDESGNKKEEAYILEAIISVDKNVVWIVYPDEKSETITFNASSSKGDIVSYYWNFTGGNNWDAEGVEVVTHGYSEAGHYIVKLKVVDVNEDHDYDTIDVYVNYKAEYEGNITKDEEEKSYLFPLKISAQSATITLQYEPYDPYPYNPVIDNVNDLDLYVYYNESDDSEVKNSSTSLDPKATGTIKEVVELSRNDLLYNLTGMRASVKWAPDCVSDAAIEYTLRIEVYYNS